MKNNNTPWQWKHLELGEVEVKDRIMFCPSLHQQFVLKPGSASGSKCSVCKEPFNFLAFDTQKDIDMLKELKDTE